MIKLFKVLLVSTLIFHVLNTTYVINKQDGEMTNLHAEIVRLEERLNHEQLNHGTDNELRRQAATGLDTMSKTYLGQPHASDEFIKRLRD
jgi:hypothetical protein